MDSSALIILTGDETTQNIVKNTEEYQSLLTNASVKRTEVSSFPDNGKFLDGSLTRFLTNSAFL